ncbi:MAG TPA: UDP-N-acetylglucosamine 2-epimerase (non-hydrolyzing) [Casimicrobiaceae bacterium]|nr:UDP-N-acetylglucosamine 2-epimerase (non-hydrolyzing) [Casimicrobiaceae bacterium]
MPPSAPARIACVFGTRPEVVKMAPVIAALARDPRFTPVVVNTGQHRELLAETMALFRIVPDVALDLMQPGQRLAGFFGRCVEALDRSLDAIAPAAVVAQGDTSTVLAAALCAFYQDRPFFHVEAGLRTGDFRNPFPEEMNREIASRFATLHFAPTAAARANLLAERVPDGAIVVTGNTVIDALLMVRDLAIPHGIARTPGKRLVVVTAHRRENFGAPMRGMLRALETIAARWPDVEIVYPAHPNPEVRRAIADEIGPRGRVRIVEPLPYGPFVTLLAEATLILTDSGGIQEEAPALGKPVLVLRDETERPEAIDAGVARLVGTDERRIVEEAGRLLDDPEWYAGMARGASPYGDGKAAARIVDAIGRCLEAAPPAR